METKRGKRLLACLIIAVMMFSGIPAISFAAGEGETPAANTESMIQEQGSDQDNNGLQASDDDQVTIDLQNTDQDDQKADAEEQDESGDKSDAADPAKDGEDPESDPASKAAEDEDKADASKAKPALRGSNDAEYVLDVSKIATTNGFNQDIDLLKDVTVTPDTYMDGENEVPVLIRVKSATPSNTASGFDSSGDYDPETSTLNVKDEDAQGHKRAQVTYTVVYEAYVGDTVLATESVDILFFDDSKIGETVNEDVAYISKAEVTDTVDGTASFDGEDGPGYDSGDHNKTVRSFDTVTSTLSLTNAVYPDSDYAKYKDGYVGFEFVLEGTSQQIEFAEDYMTWLQTKDATYKLFEVEKDGKTYQVMRGRYLWESAEEGQPAIGAANMSIDVAYTVLAMNNGDEVQPDFTFWMEHNDVPQKDVAINDFPTSDYIFVKDSIDECSAHGRVEPVHIQGDKIKVSATPWYNVQLGIARESTTQALGYWDLATGQYSRSSETENSIYGRSMCYGVTIQIRRPDGKGLKGCEMPDGSDITLSLDLSDVSYKTDSGITYRDEITSFTPILWSCEGNDNFGNQSDGRQLGPNDNYAVLAAPKNKFVQGLAHSSCYDGGTWDAVQIIDKDKEDEKNIVNITVSDYKINLDQLPSTTLGNGSYTYTYYNRETKKSLNDVWAACFSAGEFWFVMPFYDYDIQTDGAGNVSVTKGEYIVDAIGESGTFTSSIKEGNVAITSASGQTMTETTSSSDNSNQTKQDDDKKNVSVYVAKSGSLSSIIAYNEYGVNGIGNKNALTEGCHQNGRDWVTAGGKLSLSGTVLHQQGDLEFIGFAYDELIKFDNDFFEIEKAVAYALVGNNSETRGRVLYAAKPDGTGWNHAGLKPGEEGYDQEMKETEADDLVYFSSLSELKSAGYTCVGALAEHRRHINMLENNYRTPGLRIDGTAINNTENFNNVFMITHETHVWRRNKVIGDIQEYYNDQNPTNEQISDYMWNVFPSKRGNEEGSCVTYDNYPAQALDKRYSTSPALRTYKKVVYNADGTISESTGNGYADSCLVIGYVTGIAIDCAQKTNSDKEKVAYDMDISQRVVDYVIHPTIKAVGKSSDPSAGDGTAYTTTVTVETTLPAKLSYIPNSSYLGGTYNQTKEGRQGTVTDGKLLDTIVTENEDGTTTLKYVYEVTVDWSQVEGDIANLDPIYFSCDIGEVGAEDDVVNNEQLTVTTNIESTEDNQRVKNATNGNKAEQTIQISKGAAVSIVDSAEHIAVDTGDNVAFTSRVVNDSNNDKKNAATIVHVPMSGYTNSHFKGDREIVEFSVPAEGYTVWYTTDTGSFDRDDYTAGEVTGAGSGWTQLTVGADGKVDLTGVDTTKIAAFAVIGDIPAFESLDMRTELAVPEDEAGDFFQHWVSLDGLTNYARSYVVKRSIRGLAWTDKNADGLQVSSELPDSTVAPITVTLLKLKDGGDASSIDDYEVFTYGSDSKEATIALGKSIDLVTNELSDMSGYQYDFTNMPEGTYAVRFNTNGDETINNRYRITEKDVNGNANDDIDSDADYKRTRSTAVWGVVDGSFITDIELPATESITTSHYVTRYHDLGITVVTYDLSFEKKVTKLDGSTTDPDPDKEFTFTVKVGSSADALSNYAGKYTVTDASGKATNGLTTNGQIKLKDGETGLIEDLEIDTFYKIIEAAAGEADGYIYATNFDSADNGALTSQTKDAHVIVTNEYKTVEVPVTKSWSNYDGSDEFKATVTLTAKVGEDEYTLPEGTETTHTFTSPDEDTYTFKDLPAKTPDGRDITYTVSETGLSSEATTVSSKSGTYYIYSKTETPHVEGGPSYKLLGKWVPTVTAGADGTEIVNDWTPATDEEEGTTGFSIRKVDDHGNVITAKKATFKVEKKTETGTEKVGEYETIDGIAAIADLAEGKYVITESQSPSGFLDNDASFELEITKDLKLKEIKETDLINLFRRFFSFIAGTSQSPYSWDGEKFELTVKNREATEATVKKVWHDGEDAAHKRPTTLTFELYQGSGNSKEAVKDAEGNAVTVTLPKDSKWEDTVTDLPKYDAKGNEIEYTWEETGLSADYDLTDTSKEGTETTFTNTLKTQVTVNKEWKDQDDESLISSSIEVKLLANGSEKDTAELNKSNNWSHTFGATADDVLYAYDEQGSKITYTVEETKPDGYTPTYTPVTNADGTVTISIENKYKATGKLKLGGLKKLDVATGKIVAEQFKFTVTDNGAEIATGTNDKDGNIIFEPAEITYTYDASSNKDDRGKHTIVISETGADGNGAKADAEDVTVEVTVTDKGDGTLTVTPGDITDKVEMTNSYEAKGAIPFSGKKSISNGRRIESGEVFKFTVTENGKTVATGTSDADGNISFTEIEYTLNKDKDDTGLHTYTVTEDSYDSKGVRNSEKTYTVTVDVKDKGDGTLIITPSEEHSGLDFENPYEAKGEITVPVTKVLENRQFKDGDEWTFTIEPEDGAPLPVDEDGNEVTTVTLKPTDGNEAETVLGTFRYDLSDLGGKAYETKTFTYTITESGEIKGVKNDPDTDRVLKIKVTDDGSGVLTVEKADDSEEVKFVNTYETSGEITFSGKKTLNGDTLKAGQFSFELYDKDGKLLETVTNKADGTYSFKTIKYTGDDLDKDADGNYVDTTKTYKVVEKKGDDPQITYDSREYKITVTLKDDGQGSIKAAADPKEGSLDFTNTYTPDEPHKGVKTGDDSHAGLYLGLMLLCGALLAGIAVYRKRRADR